MSARDLKRLAEAVKGAREQLGLSQEEFAARGPMSIKTVQRVEWATAAPQAPTYKKVDTAAGWPPGTARSIAEAGGAVPDGQVPPAHEWSAAERDKMRSMSMAEVQETYEFFQSKSQYLADIWQREVIRVKAEAEATAEATTDR